MEVSKRMADYGVVPVENSTEGVVTHTLDMFDRQRFKDGVADRPADSAVSDVQYADDKIRKLYVHPQSLAQCRGWLARHLPKVEIVETSSNARSAELAAGEKFSAALGGALAAEKYGFKILAAGHPRQHRECDPVHRVGPRNAARPPATTAPASCSAWPIAPVRCTKPSPRSANSRST